MIEKSVRSDMFGAQQLHVRQPHMMINAQSQLHVRQTGYEQSLDSGTFF